MISNIIGIIQNKLQQLNIEYDTRIGSAIYDLFIVPLSEVLKDYLIEHERILKLQSFSNINSMDSAQLDNLGFNYFIQRLQGTYATGQLYIHINEPKSFSVPKGTIFYTDAGIQYRTTREFTCNSFSMLNFTYEDPYYNIGPIPIVSVNVGSEYNIPAKTLFNCDSLTITPAKITNISNIVSGTTPESNLSFYSRIQNTLHSNTLASPVAIYNIISSYLTSLVDLKIIGAGHDYMTRDLIYNVGDSTIYRYDSFFGAHSGQHSSLYDCKHIAYTGNIVDPDDTDNIKISSSIAVLTAEEFSDSMYEGIYSAISNTSPAITEKKALLYITELDISKHINKPYSWLIESGIMNLYDGTNINCEKRPNEFNITQLNTGSYIQLGKTYRNILSASVFFEYEKNNSIYDDTYIKFLRDECLNKYRQASIPHTPEWIEMVTGDKNESAGGSLLAYKEILISRYTKKILDYKAQNLNFSPVIQKMIPFHHTIEIVTRIMTDDATEEGQMCYITTLRNSVNQSGHEIAAPHDGYGIAWRKQPAYLIRLANKIGTQDDANLFNKEYNTNYSLSDLQQTNFIKGNKAYWKYNIYLVENDILLDNVWIGSNQLFDHLNGRNQFIQASKYWIEPNIEYEFRIHIGSSFDTNVWINEPEKWINVNDEKVISRGATTPVYYSQSGEEIGTKTNFGIGILETQYNSWYISHIAINPLSETFPIQIFKFDLAATMYNSDSTIKPDYDFNSPLYIKYCGKGYDKTKWLNNNEGLSKVVLKIYNPNIDTQNGAEAWEVLASGVTDLETINLDPNPENYTISGYISIPTEYLIDDKILYIAAIGANAGSDFPYDEEHILETYYIEINNGKLNGIHRGNCVDIYCHDPQNIVTTYSDPFILQDNIIRLSSIPSINSYIHEILDIVSSDDISLNLGSEYFYILENPSNEGLAYSSSNDIIIVLDPTFMDFNGLSMRLKYSYWTLGDSIDTHINNTVIRFPGTSYMIKTMPPTVITLEKLQYSGGIEINEMKLKIKDYINTLKTGRLDKSDLIYLLYNNGATYVNTDIKMSVRKYNPHMSKMLYTSDSSSTTQGFTLASNELSRFFTSIEELYGVAQI